MIAQNIEQVYTDQIGLIMTDVVAHDWKLMAHSSSAQISHFLTEFKCGLKSFPPQYSLLFMNIGASQENYLHYTSQSHEHCSV